MFSFQSKSIRGKTVYVFNSRPSVSLYVGRNNIQSLKLSTNKLEQQKRRLFDTVDQFCERLLVLCDSDIEKQFLLDILFAIFNDKLTPSCWGFTGENSYREWQITEFEPIVDSVCVVDLPTLSVLTYEAAGYELLGFDFVKVIGLKFIDEAEYLPLETRTEYFLYPQYKINLQSDYRLDFALLSKNMSGDDIVSERKIAIECDGFEFHSTSKKMTEDNIRTRELLRNDWIVFRMSGSEIFNINDERKIYSVLNELRTLSKRFD